MRFLILTPQTYPEYSGSGLNALKFASHLVKSGHSACILTLNQNKKYPTQEQAQNVNIQRITYFNRNIFIKLMSGPGLLFNYIKYISKSDILMIYGAQMHAYQLSIIIAKILGKKVVFRSTLMDTDDVRTL
ncbi:MAG: hypothetical protein MI922_11225, partial [Bacteroidales bacterium]|nr:hypothetical protein [Bacteroidales bacterium]